MAKAADFDFQTLVGAEVEYFLVQRNDDGSIRTADPDDDAAQPCYDARGVFRMYDHLTSISTTITRTATGSSSRTFTTPMP
jgi:glutamine synthetase